MNGTSLSALLFLITGALSALYLLLEAVLQAFGKSICLTEGCKVVAQSTRFGDLTMVLLGLGTVVLVTVLAARGMRTASTGRDRVVNFLLITSLAGEGFFVGYQLFRLNAVCIFCLSVFGIFVVLGALRVLAGHREVLAGFGALLAVLSLFYLVLPSGGTALPLDQQYVLFYSPDCKHCTEIRKELEAGGIAFRHVEVKDYAATLKSLGIEHVPTMLVNGPQEKHFLTGVEVIRRHLLPAAAPKPAKKQRPATPSGKGDTGQPAGRFDLFAPGANPAFDPLPDAGLCKENVKCE